MTRPCFFFYILMNLGVPLYERITAMGDVAVLLSEANEQIMNADTKEKLRGLLETYERVLESDPSNYEALWSLGRSRLAFFLLSIFFAKLLVHLVQLDAGAQQFLAVFNVTCVHNADIRGGK